jgi:hypothetical protein
MLKNTRKNTKKFKTTVKKAISNTTTKCTNTCNNKTSSVNYNLQKTWIKSGISQNLGEEHVQSMCLGTRESKREESNKIFLLLEHQRKHEMRRRERSPNFLLAWTTT